MATQARIIAAGSMADHVSQLHAPTTSTSRPNQSQNIRINKNDPRTKDHTMLTVADKDGTINRIWECSICHRRFKHQYTLARHIPVHTDERSYKCSSCPKAFRQLSTLAQHKVTHSDERPFTCSVCCKTFNRVSTLSSHIKIHFPEKMHVCTVCDKGFHQKVNLRNHMHTHTNSRPYKCEICGRGFNQRSNLSCHMASIHFKKTIRCELCPKTFSRLHSWVTHTRKEHEIGSKDSTGKPATLPNVQNEAELIRVQNNNDETVVDLNALTLAAPRCGAAQNPPTMVNRFLLTTVQPVPVTPVGLVHQDGNTLVYQEIKLEVPQVSYFGPSLNNQPIILTQNSVRTVGLEVIRPKRRLNIPSVKTTVEDEAKYFKESAAPSCPQPAVNNPHPLPTPPPSLESLLDMKCPVVSQACDTFTLEPPESHEVQRIPVHVQPPRIGSRLPHRPPQSSSFPPCAVKAPVPYECQDPMDEFLSYVKREPDEVRLKDEDRMFSTGYINEAANSTSHLGLSLFDDIDLTAFT